MPSASLSEKNYPRVVVPDNIKRPSRTVSSLHLFPLSFDAFPFFHNLRSSRHVAFRSFLTVSAAILVGSTSAITVGVDSTTVVHRSINYPREDLQSRQLNGIQPVNIPAACKETCRKTLSVAECEDSGCVCSNEMASSVQSCYSCALVASDKYPQEKYQSIANDYVSACKQYGFTINHINISKDNVNGTNVNGTNVNGTNTNGTSTNGTSVNGTSVNGTNTNGTSVNGTDSSAGKNNGAFGLAPTFGLLALSAAALILA